MAVMQRITSNLWFDKQAEQAVQFYLSVFKDSKLGRVTKYSKEGFDIHRMPEGAVMTIGFWLDGHEFVALNGGPHFQFNEAVSFIVNCDTQEEVDYYWDKLSAGGDPKAQICGWLKDQYGLSWQVVPRILNELMSDADQSKADKAMRAMLQMRKINIAELEKAVNA